MALRSLTLLNPSGSTSPVAVTIPEDCEYLGFVGYGIALVSTDENVNLTDLFAGQGNFDPAVLINNSYLPNFSYPLRKGSVVFVTYSGQGWGQLIFGPMTAENQVSDFA